MLPPKTEILVIGAGPTGLALAACLQKAGVDHLIVDALAEGQNTSRAAVIHAHTLEMLETIGVAEPLVREGLMLERFSIRDRDERLLSIDFNSLPSVYRHILMVPQPTTESMLRERLAGLGGTVHRGVRAVSIDPSHHGAKVSLVTPEGLKEIEARYVVGADGMHSLVRDTADIDFQGEVYGESFVLADVRMEWPLNTDEVSLFFSPAGLVVVAPLPDGSFRIVATMETAPEQPGIPDVQHLLDTRGPAFETCRITELVWSSRFRVHHRLAACYRRGPLVLMGDAAHVHSPAGGQGMNTGLVDAIVLGDALTRVLRDREAETLLDDYARVRRMAACEVLRLASRLTWIATIRSSLGRRLRNLILRKLEHSPKFKRKLSLGLSGIGRRSLAVLPALAPTLTTPIKRGDGRDRPFVDLSARPQMEGNL